MSVRELPPFDGAYLSAWTLAWAPDALIVVATIAYAALWWRAPRRHDAPHLRRVGPLVAWMAAMLCLIVCFNSSVGIYSDTLFWVHMVQHLILIMVIPPLLIWAEPLTLVPTRDPERSVAQALRRSRIWRALTNPFLSVPLYTATVVLTHLTSFQQLAVGHTATRTGENVLYLVVGFVLFSPLVTLERGDHRLPDLIRFVVLVASMGADTLAGVILMQTQRLVAPAYAASHPGWGPGALADQSAAGAIMWFFGDGLMMLLMVIAALQWGLHHQDSGLGDWLEGVRRRQILGEGYDDAASDPDVDLDEAALDAYNAYLARLNEGDRRRE